MADMLPKQSVQHGLTRSVRNKTATFRPKSQPLKRAKPESTSMQHYQVPSVEYSSYINHVISLGLAEDYIAQLRASCSPNSPPPFRAAIDQACRHLSGIVDDLQPVPASAAGAHSLETLGQQNGARSQRQQLAWQLSCLTLRQRNPAVHPENQCPSCCG